MPLQASRQLLFLFIAGLSLILLVAFSLSVGQVHFSYGQLFSLFEQHSSTPESQIFYELRLPRVLLAALIGGALAVSGAVMQGIFRNPLADPGLIGVSAGSALGISFAIVLSQTLKLAPSYPVLALSAFLFGMLAMGLVYLIALKNGQSQIATLLLSGVALSAFCSALSALFIYLSSDQQLRLISFWNLGSFSGSSWSDFKVALLIILPAVFVLWLLAKSLDILLLGEKQARHLGVSVEKVKLVAFILVSLVVSLSVSMVGIIGFVGLVVPHLARMLFGASHAFLLVMSFFLGATLLLLADTLSRSVISPAELPIGILTALIGCPFFIFLLIKNRKQVLFQ